MDESESQNSSDDYFVLGGCISTEDRWAKFSKDWNILVQKFGRLDNSGQRYFHMTEMHSIPDISAFYRVIEENVAGYISVRFKKSNLTSALSRILVNGKPISLAGGDWLLAFRYLMDLFHNNRGLDYLRQIIPPDAVVQFYFDDTQNKKHIFQIWDKYIESRQADVKSLYGKSPIFEDDRVFSPLQAADFWVWWVRKWWESGDIESKIGVHNFGMYHGTRGRPRVTVDILFNEENIISEFINMARGEIGPEAEIIVLPSSLQFLSFSK